MISSFLSHTPAYVYFVFMYLLYVGWQASKGRVISIYKNIITVGVFLYLAITGITRLDLGFFYYTWFLILMCFFCYLGWGQAANAKIVVDKKEKTIRLPGSWTTLVVVLIVFGFKYYLGYQNSQDPSFILGLQSKILTILVSSFSLGLMAGRLINLLYRLHG